MNNKIIILYKKNKTQEEISNILNIPEGIIRDIIRDYEKINKNK